MPERGFTRRTLLTGLFRAAPNPAEAPADPAAIPPADEPLVDAFRRILQRRADVLPWGLPESELPAPAETIRESLLSAARGETSQWLLEQLGHAYSSLPWFCSPADLEILRAGKTALESMKNDAGARETLIRAYEVRGRMLQESTRLSREFDQQLREWAASVRAATVDDAGTVAAIHTAAWQATRRGLAPRAALEAIDLASETARWQELLRGEAEMTFVAYGRAGPVGFSRVVLHPDSGEIASLEVVPTEWRRGYGRKLCDRMLEELCGRGVTEVVVWALEASPGAARFLESSGFTRDGATRPDPTLPESDLRETRYSRKFD